MAIFPVVLTRLTLHTSFSITVYINWMSPWCSTSALRDNSLVGSLLKRIFSDSDEHQPDAVVPFLCFWCPTTNVTTSECLLTYCFRQWHINPCGRRLILIIRCSLMSCFVHVNVSNVARSINQSINQSVSQSVNQSVSQSVSQSINQSINQSVSQSFICSIKAVKFTACAGNNDTVHDRQRSEIWRLQLHRCYVMCVGLLHKAIIKTWSVHTRLQNSSW